MASSLSVPTGSVPLASCASPLGRPSADTVSSGPGLPAPAGGHARDTEMIDRLLADDESVLRDVFDVYGEQIAFVLHRASSGSLRREEIDDVLNITVYRLWRCRRRFCPRKGRLKTWLLGIARVVACEYRKSRWCAQRQNECVLAGDRLETLAIASEISSAVDIVDRQAAQDALRDKVRQALSSLPPNYARVLWAFASATEGEITSGVLAAEMGLTASTIRVYRKRGLAMLKEKLEGDGISEALGVFENDAPRHASRFASAQRRRALPGNAAADVDTSAHPESGPDSVTRKSITQ